MAIVTFSRQVAAMGDEIAQALASKIGYKFFTRRDIENRIVELGFPKDKLEKYDERKPGFFASLAKGRDEYLNYLQYAVLEAASQDNCILIGRGAFYILRELDHMVSFRFVADEKIREQRLMDEFKWNEKQAQERIRESAENRKGFHKSFFNIDNESSENFMLTMNSGIMSVDRIVNIVDDIVKCYVSPEMEEKGKKKIANMLKCQELVNKLLFEHKLNINFLRAVMDEEGKQIRLQGVAESMAISERAVQLTGKLIPDVEIKNGITIVQDFKTY